jgi:UDP-N-acetyl-D-galactosamine dehydrogenase
LAGVGLGYVGLPLAVGFASKHDVVGFDVSSAPVKSLRDGVDSTNEVTAEELAAAPLVITDDMRRTSDASATWLPKAGLSRT